MRTRSSEQGRALAPLVVSLALLGCVDPAPVEPDAGRSDAGAASMDAGAADAGSPDSGPPARLDAGGQDAFGLPDGHVRGTPLSITASSSAPGHPIELAIDGDASTSWVAFDATGPHANYAWIEIDFGVEVHVETLRLSAANAPSPGFLPSHFVVWAFDGVEWSHAASRFDDVSAGSVEVPVDHNAVRLWIDVSRVHDGTGWAAAIDELSMDVLPDPVVTAPAPCDTTLTAGTDLNAYFAEPANARDQTVCVEAGTYAGPVWINAARSLTVRALGAVTIEAERSGLDGSGGAMATFIVTQASGLVIEGLRIVNTHRYVHPFSSQLETVARAVEVLNSDDVRFVDAEIESFGKQTTWIIRSTGVVFEGVTFRGTYFLVVAFDEGVVLNRCAFHTDLSFVLPDDDHAPLWAQGSAIFLRDTTMNMVTGNGLLSGPQPAGNLFVNVSGTFVANGMTEWVHVHPNYPRLRLQLGPEAPALSPFYYNPFQGGGLGPGTELCSFAGAASCVYPSL